MVQARRGIVGELKQAVRWGGDRGWRARRWGGYLCLVRNCAQWCLPAVLLSERACDVCLIQWYYWGTLVPAGCTSVVHRHLCW